MFENRQHWILIILQWDFRDMKIMHRIIRLVMIRLQALITAMRLISELLPEGVSLLTKRENILYARKHLSAYLKACLNSLQS